MAVAAVVASRLAEDAARAVGSLFAQGSTCANTAADSG